MGKNYRKQWIWSALLIAAVLLTGCGKSYDFYYQESMQEWKIKNTLECEDLGLMEESEEITSEEATKEFQEFYGLSELTGQSAWWNGEMLQITFEFGEKVPFYQIDQARSYVLNRFVLGIVNEGSRTQYENWLLETGLLKSGEVLHGVRCQIYVGEMLILWEEYEEQKVTGYFENPIPVIEARMRQPEDLQQLEQNVIREIPKAAIQVQNALSGAGRIVTVETGRKYKPEKVAATARALTEAAFDIPVETVVFQAEGRTYYIFGEVSGR